MNNFRLPLLILTAALFSAAAWADGIDPKVIPQNGGGSTPITITNPNPTVTGNVQTTGCFESAPACVNDVFQNQTGTILKSITMFFANQAAPSGGFFSFGCGDMTKALFFDNCTPKAVSGGEDLIFSADNKNGHFGVLPAICIPDTFYELLHGCDGDADDWHGGEFAMDIYASTQSEANDLTKVGAITTTAITATPEPPAGLMVISSALVVGLFKLLRRAA